MKSIQDIRIRFIGAGNMAASLIGGLINKGLTASQITASDPGENQRQYIEKQFQVLTYGDNNSHFGMPDIVLIAVKPQIMKTVLADVKDTIQRTQPLVISVAAGITTEQITQWLGAELPVVRTMPNTPALIGQGAIGMYANAAVGTEQKQLTEQVMDAVGTSIWVKDEYKIDAVTALSGSGPAYFFMFMEYLQQAAEKLGLSAEDAALLTKKTAIGAALLAERSPESLTQLKDRVTSPNGTTAAALDSFAASKIDQTIEQAVHAANERSVTLSKEFD
ncbi:pyrroline-5-carboxylate reductase [Marinicella sp. S1101]|uniref:pyrroline-5-carboxylate reductase n=1 Tax=Marinicella marina TaxID=2996016 RepID=UPI002260DA19|nr:pyrroline-5-carboxylate reductase [Marinicella marina]MCX7553485.1 pyrroline-5-carboxylate reductase [Marinicella marina]MDJ1140109.1 pyrroline-5-carboxylate reductase [Marinicella marina]